MYEFTLPHNKNQVIPNSNGIQYLPLTSTCTSTAISTQISSLEDNDQNNNGGPALVFTVMNCPSPPPNTGLSEAGSSNDHVFEEAELSDEEMGIRIPSTSTSRIIVGKTKNVNAPPPRKRSKVNRVRDEPKEIFVSVFYCQFVKLTLSEILTCVRTQPKSMNLSISPYSFNRPARNHVSLTQNFTGFLVICILTR